MTASIKATEPRRPTRKSGVNMYSEQDEMKKQLDSNFKNMQQMETTINTGASPHDGSTQSERVAISVFERPIQSYHLRSSSQPSTISIPRATSTRMHSRHASKPGTPTRSGSGTAKVTPAQYSGNPGSEVITDAITKLTHEDANNGSGTTRNAESTAIETGISDHPSTASLDERIKDHGRTPKKASQPTPDFRETNSSELTVEVKTTNHRR